MPHSQPEDARSTPANAVVARPRDDLAYVAPMAAFLVVIWVATQVRDRWPSAYPWAFPVRYAVAAALLAALWRRYTRISWRHWRLGVLVGVVGVVQWVGMQLALQHQWPKLFAPGVDAFDPTKAFASPAAAWGFVVVRTLGAVLVVPVMEELFWRDFLWRQLAAPNDFKLARIGEWDPAAFFGVAGGFALVHGGWWLTSIVWALLVGLLLLRTRSLGACVVAHAVTNLLLAVYVVVWRDWGFW